MRRARPPTPRARCPRCARPRHPDGATRPDRRRDRPGRRVARAATRHLDRARPPAHRPPRRVRRIGRMRWVAPRASPPNCRRPASPPSTQEARRGLDPRVRLPDRPRAADATAAFTAAFVANDQMALGFIHAAMELGRTVPGDLSVVGFDDIPESAHFVPPLTTVRQDFDLIGRRAVELLLAALEGTAPPPRRPGGARAGGARIHRPGRIERNNVTGHTELRRTAHNETHAQERSRDRPDAHRGGRAARRAGALRARRLDRGQRLRPGARHRLLRHQTLRRLLRRPETART